MTYIAGNPWFICDRCGQKYRRAQMRREWSGLIVDAQCLDPRPPEMTPPDIYPEGMPVRDPRPPQDNFAVANVPAGAPFPTSEV